MILTRQRFPHRPGSCSTIGLVRRSCTPSFRARRCSPRFYGGDRAAGLVVVEDLGDSAGLHMVLQGSESAAAEASLVKLAALLGRMHAQTIGREAEFNQVRDALGPHARTTFYTYDWMADAWEVAVATLNVTPTAGWQRELEALMATMRAPGPFLAYTHGDPCPDNVLRVNGWPAVDRLRYRGVSSRVDRRGLWPHSFSDLLVCQSPTDAAARGYGARLSRGTGAGVSGGRR